MGSGGFHSGQHAKGLGWGTQTANAERVWWARTRGGERRSQNWRGLGFIPDTEDLIRRVTLIRFESKPSQPIW